MGQAGAAVLGGGASGSTGTLYFYSITGQRLGTYTLNYLAGTQTSVNMYFGKRLLAAVDRLGSVRDNRNGAIAYYPWGEERTATPDGADKFATYFETPSPASAKTTPTPDTTTTTSADSGARTREAESQQIRRTLPAGTAYAYVSDDPINKTDPSGFCSPQDDPPCYSVTGWGGDVTGWGGDPGPQGAWNGWGGYTFIFHAIQETSGPGGGASATGPLIDTATNRLARGLLQARFKTSGVELRQGLRQCHRRLQHL